jgi:hypothetical protein
MAKILFIVKLLASLQSRCGRARYRESLLYFDPHVIQPPSFVAGLFNSLSQFAKEVQNELAFVVRENAFDFVNGIRAFITVGIFEPERVCGRRAIGRSLLSCKVTKGSGIRAVLTREGLLAVFQIGEAAKKQDGGVISKDGFSKAIAPSISALLVGFVFSLV